jgi:tetratricopeptide (TPR) repeat protein
VTCPNCATQNIAGRSNCSRCGAALVLADSPAGDVPPKPRELRLAIILPLCLLVSVTLAVLIWGWHSGSGERSSIGSQSEGSAEDPKKVADALARVPLANARAKDCLRTGSFEAGLKIVDEVLAVVDVPELQETKVNLLMAAGRDNEAYELLLILLKSRPEAPHLHFFAGKVAMQVKDGTTAMLHFAEACRLAPDNKAYQIAWAKASLKAGLRDSAIATFTKLLEEDPQCSQCWLDYAGAFYASGDKPQAIRLLQQAVTRSPNSASFNYYLALLLDSSGSEKGDSEALRAAAGYYRKSLELQPRKNSLAAKRYYEITSTRVPSELEAIRVDELPLEQRGSQLLITAMINGIPGRFVLDTGASVTCIVADSVSRFKIVPTSRTGTAITPMGITQTPLAYADITLGRHTIRQALISVMSQSPGPGIDGLMGLDSMQKLNGQVDTRRGLLVIQNEDTEALSGN